MATIKDVAKLARVSVASVSRYLNNPEVLREETRQRIKDAVKQLHYRPSIIAQGMRHQNTKTIALIIQDLDNPFYSRVQNGAQQSAANHGYNLVVLTEYGKNINFYTDLLIRNKFVGAIYCIRMDRKDAQHLYDLRAIGMPVVLIDNELFTDEFTTINTDNFKAAYMGTEYLISKGHCDIALVCFSNFSDQEKKRRQGYRKALEFSSLPFSEENVYETELSLNGGMRIAEKLLGEVRAGKYTAVFAISDLIAIGMLKYFTNQGVRIPSDVSILGFDDISWSEITIPSLTTVHQRLSKLGSLAVSQLVYGLRKPRNKPSLIELGAHIVERDSVQAISTSRAGDGTQLQ
jgi:DNA-binding LacI/PurR family transcriptional regulator